VKPKKEKDKPVTTTDIINKRLAADNYYGNINVDKYDWNRRV
jgi:hypothetical protein